MPHEKLHHYTTTVTWTGNMGSGTSSYRAYERAHEVAVEGKPTIAGSSDAAFRGDPTRWTPEDMLVASISTCHMLWYLHLVTVAKIVVTAYVDHAEGEMIEEASGAGRFTKVTLRPEIVLAAGTPPEQIEAARAIHHEAHEMCFVAQSVNFPIETEGAITIATE